MKGSSGRLRLVGSQLTPYVIGVGAAIASAGLLLALLGKSVPQGLSLLLTSSFGSASDLGLFFLKFVPLLLMALAFAVPFILGKFNVGNEGQFLLGAVGAVTAAFTFSSYPGYVAIPMLIVFSLGFGIVWALVPALMLYRFKVNEIVSTIMMNFVAEYLVLWVATGPWRDVAAGAPETKQIPGAFQMPLLSSNPEVSLGLVVALFVPFILYYYVYRSVSGYELRAAGSNPRASSVFGINSRLLAPMALVIGGAIAGLAGGFEVAGLQLRLVQGMESDYGPLALIIALIAGGNPLGVTVTAIFISVIEIGGSAMNAVMGVPSELVYVIEALLLLFILMANVYKRRRK